MNKPCGVIFSGVLGYFSPTLLKILSGRGLPELCASSKDIRDSIFATQVLVLKIKLDNQIEINGMGRVYNHNQFF